MAKNVLTLTSAEALDFFLSHDRYFDCELPEYFDFDRLLRFVRNSVGDKTYEDCTTDVRPDELADANLEILFNKDGRYAVRPMTLVNPYLYYFLVREICAENNWRHITACFKHYASGNIEASALPVIPEEKEAFHHSTAVLNWWSSIEQRSLELSLEYRYMFVSDITNCYGTVNHQTIEWALSLKGTKHENNECPTLATNIVRFLRAMQQGRNMGMPQGSAVFDFIAEIILGYADALLAQRIKELGIEDYAILRYRDDYRIFCNDRDQLEKISYTLQGILESLNFRMNSQKTKISETLVIDSIKPDKLWYIENTPIFNKKGVDFDGIQKHLIYILLFGRKHPNGGQLKTMLSDLNKRIIQNYSPKSEGGKGLELKENIAAICAVATQIAIDNVNTSHYALQVISRVVGHMKNEDERRDLIVAVRNKLLNRPNSLYNQLWLQNITYHIDVANGKQCPYSLRLCQLAMGKTREIWNCTWLKPEITKGLPVASICDKKKLKKGAPVIVFRERRHYIDVNEREAKALEAIDKQVARAKKMEDGIRDHFGNENIEDLDCVRKELNDFNPLDGVVVKSFKL